MVMQLLVSGPSAPPLSAHDLHWACADVVPPRANPSAPWRAEARTRRHSLPACSAWVSAWTSAPRMRRPSCCTCSPPRRPRSGRRAGTSSASPPTSSSRNATCAMRGANCSSPRRSTWVAPHPYMRRIVVVHARAAARTLRVAVLITHDGCAQVQQLLDRGGEREDQGDTAGALQLYSQALSLEPEHHELRAHIGWVTRRLNAEAALARQAQREAQHAAHHMVRCPALRSFGGEQEWTGTGTGQQEPCAVGLAGTATCMLARMPQTAKCAAAGLLDSGGATPSVAVTAGGSPRVTLQRHTACAAPAVGCLRLAGEPGRQPHAAHGVRHLPAAAGQPGAQANR